MKKFILTSCLSFITMSMFAFTPLRFGVQIGVNSNKTDKDNISNGGYSLGVFTEIPTIGQLYLCPGLNFTQKTSTLSYKNIGFGGYYVGKDELKINYLEIPILFKYKFLADKEISIFTSAGTTFSFGLNGTKGDNYKDVFKDLKNGSDIYASKFDLGLNANIGIEIFNKAQVSLGYNIGTSEVNKDIKAQKTKNRTTTLSIAYLF